MSQQDQVDLAGLAGFPKPAKPRRPYTLATGGFLSERRSRWTVTTCSPIAEELYTLSSLGTRQP